jgi:isoleucyl-tRNA synthetase
LRREGLAREIVRSLNDLRKEVGLDIADRITLSVAADGPVADALATHREYVMAEVLAVDLTTDGAPGAAAHELAIDGHPVRVTLTRAGVGSAQGSTGSDPRMTGR